MARRLRDHPIASVAIGIALLVGIAAVAARLLRNTTTPVSVGEAVSRLDGAPGAAGSGRVGGVPVPPSGVYRYATEGGDRVDALVDGEHRYPRTTTITVSLGGCGVLMRWTALAERETELDLCPGRRGWRLAGIGEVHEFFGQRDQRRYDCPRGIAFLRRGSWGYRCEFESTRLEVSGTTVGIETLRVGGRPVRTLHVRERERVSGPETGSGATDTWYRLRDGLVVRREARSANTSSAPGREADYAEDYRLLLLSLRPAR